MSNRIGLVVTAIIALLVPIGVLSALVSISSVAHAIPLVCDDPVVEITAEKAGAPSANATTYDELEIATTDEGIRRTLRMAAKSGAYYRCRYTSDDYGISSGYITLQSPMMDVDLERSFYFEYDSEWYRIQWDIDSRTQ